MVLAMSFLYVLPEPFLSLNTFQGRVGWEGGGVPLPPGHHQDLAAAIALHQGLALASAPSVSSPHISCPVGWGQPLLCTELQELMCIYIYNYLIWEMFP